MTDVSVREAKPSDAVSMSEILRDILTMWKSERSSSVEQILSFYIDHPERLRCSVAVDASGAVHGFQSLKRVEEGNEYDLPGGWGVIGTYVDGKVARRGIGKALFASSLDAARQSGLAIIDATIGKGNHSALAYYNSMGFQTYRYMPGAICKRFVVV